MQLLTELGQQNRLQKSSFFPLSFLSQHEPKPALLRVSPVDRSGRSPATRPAALKMAPRHYPVEREAGSQPWRGALTAGRTRPWPSSSARAAGETAQVRQEVGASTSCCHGRVPPRSGLPTPAKLSPRVGVPAVA